MTEEIYRIRYDKYDMEEFGIVTYAQWLHPDFMNEREEVGLPWKFTVEQIRALRKFIKSGDTVIDIGAFVGYVMMPMMLATSPGGMVIAFEPNPASFKVLEENAVLNRGYADIKIFNKAVMSRDDKFTFHYTKRLCNGGYAEFLNRGVGATGHDTPVKVEGMMLKSCLEKENIKLKNVSFVKIDTEGYDKKVLQSIDWLIEEFKPVLRVELYSALEKWERKELFWTIEQLEYDVFWEASRFAVGKKCSMDDFIKEKTVRDVMCLPK